MATLITVTLLVAAAPAAPADTAKEAEKSSQFAEVGRIPLDAQDPGFTTFHAEGSGWLILNPGTRRAYTVFESGSETVLRSFDLDTLRPRAWAKVSGAIPIPGGQGISSGGGAAFNGDLVHAVDPVALRLYLPLSGGLGNPTLGADAQRGLAGGFVLVVDEVAFDEGRPAFGAMTLPPDQAHLGVYNLMGMTVTRKHVGPKDLGKLVAVFAAPNRPVAVPVLPVAVPQPVPYDHTLVQWDPSGVQMGRRAEDLTFGTAVRATPASGEWSHVLGVCATAPMTGSAGASNNYSRGILVTDDAVYTGCQSAPESAAVARVTLDADTGAAVPSLTGERVFPLGRIMADALADPRGRRLFVRTAAGNGNTWWVFDATTEQFSGSIAASTGPDTMAAGVDPRTGRFFTLTADTCVDRPGGGLLPVRGGIKFVEAGLDPVPAPEIVRADMAYPSQWGIQTDPVTRRVFVRRGWSSPSGDTSFTTYPNCEPSGYVKAVRERFWRVFEDGVPLVERPPDLDDSIFTTNVKEVPGITQASYLGSGQGYGARIVLTGGYDSLTEGNASKISPACGKDDREFLLGSIPGASVSDISINAGAASFDADSRTQNNYTSPYNKCRPSNGNTQAPESPQDTDALDFDRNKDGINDYLTSCLDDESSPSTSTRQGFTSEVVCDPKNQIAQGISTVDSSLEGIITLAYSHSKVTVQKDLIQGGITVKVTSIARGIDIPGIGKIGTVQTEVTSRSAGRIATAQTTFKRTICGIDLLGKEPIPICLSEQDQKGFQKTFNEQFSGKYGIAFRNPDPKLAKGSPSGYQAAVQRDRKELFQDQVISRDASLAVPGLELVVYKDGDGGARRQIYQFAGAQAATSYGIVCLYGQADSGTCNTDSFTSGYADLTDGTGLEDYAPSGYDNEEVFASAPIDTSDPGLLTKVIRSIQRFGQRVGEGLLLALSSPMQGALVATVWALLYLPHYLAARRRLLPSINP